MKPLLLATQSSYKRGLFERLRLPFQCAASHFEERGNFEPRQTALIFSRGKAAALAPDYPGHLIIGADQVLALNEKIFTKPGSTQKAVDQLCRLQGKTHQLHTAFAIYEPHTQRWEERVVTSEITFHDRFDPNFLRQLVEEEQSQDCVGGYKFESRGFLLMARVQTPDPNAIVGLPLLELADVLRRWGYFPHHFLP